MAITVAPVRTSANADTRKFLFPFILVTSLFFLWGFSYGLLDVLNKHFQEALNITKARSTLLQFAYFGAYAAMALPAGWIIKKFGYKPGIIVGLFLYAAGAFLFFPAANARSFEFFLFALFVIACGLTCLETAANPYITVLGPQHNSEFRLNLSQSFNGVGSVIGPAIGGLLFFREGNKQASGDLGNVQFVYLVIGFVVLAIGFLFTRTKLPEIKEENTSATNKGTKGLWSYSHFKWAVAAQFFYVAAQVGVGALFINYVTEYWKERSNEQASYLLSGSLILFTVGRFAGTALMKKYSPRVLLMWYALANVLLCAIVVAYPGMIAVIALMAVFFFMSIMFPTIFALGVKDLGAHTKRASSYIIMSIVGGAFMPIVMGLIANRSTALSFIVPLLCFVIVFYFARSKAK
jgi:FHS family L-fucose permease-like MFS transporter